MLSRVKALKVAAYVLVLAILSVLFSILSLKTPDDRNSKYFLLCVVSSVLIPVLLAVARSSGGYWTGFWIFFFILGIAQITGFCVYLFETNQLPGGVDEIGVGESALWFVELYLKPSVLIAILCYPLGALAARWLVKR